MNATQLSVIEALKNGQSLRQSNKTDTVVGKVHHATVKALVKAGYIVLNADKTIALVSGAEKEEKGEASRPDASKRDSKIADLYKTLAFVTERADTCGRMYTNGTCTRERWLGWVRKVEEIKEQIKNLK